MKTQRDLDWIFSFAPPQSLLAREENESEAVTDHYTAIFTLLEEIVRTDRYNVTVGEQFPYVGYIHIRGSEEECGRLLHHLQAREELDLIMFENETAPMERVPRKLLSRLLASITRTLRWFSRLLTTPH